MKLKKTLPLLLVTAIITACSGNINSVIKSDNHIAKSEKTFLSNAEYSQLEKEYGQFKTESFSKAYLEKKLNKWKAMGVPGDTGLAKEIEFARLKHAALYCTAMNDSNNATLKNYINDSTSLLVTQVNQASLATFLAAGCPSASTLGTGLVGSWNANGDANDSKGTNHGTLTNGATASGTPKVGSNAFSFDGSNDYVSLPQVSWNFTTDFSVSFWIKPTNASPQQMLVNNFNYSGGTFKGWDIRLANGQISMTIWGSDAVVASSTAVITNGSYQLVEVVYKRGVSVEFRVNGVSNNTVSTNMVPIYPTTVTPTFGMLIYALGTGYPYSGLLDSVNIWNRATTMTESASLYNGGNGIESPY